MNVQNEVLRQLRIDVLLSAPTHEEAHKVITALSTCEEHQGCHHFAVVGEGLVVGMTKTAKLCLINQGVLP